MFSFYIYVCDTGCMVVNIQMNNSCSKCLSPITSWLCE